MKMKRTLSILAVSFFTAVMIGAGRAQAQVLDQTSAYGDARWVHNTDQGPSQNFDRRWDGKRYDDGEIDLGVHSGLKQALIDLDLNDLRSLEESGDLNVGLGSSVLLKGDFNRLTHRDGYLMPGMLLNNLQTWTPDNYIKTNAGGGSDISTGTAAQIKRDYQEEELVLSLPNHPNFRLFAGQWLQHEYGAQALVINSTLYSQGYQNYTHQVYGGLDADIGDKGQAYYQYGFQKFRNTGQNMQPIIGASWQQGAYQSNADMTSNKVAFRYNPNKEVSLAGSLIDRNRYNQFNGLTQNSYAGNLSGSYRPSKDLSFTTRLYARAVQTGYRNQYQGTTNVPVAPINFLFLNGDFDLRYGGMKDILLSASYRPQVTTRSLTAGWSQVYPSTGFSNGFSNGGINAPASEDTRHNFIGSAKFELPSGAELELSENYLIANAEAYENIPTQSSIQGISLVIPVVRNVVWMGAVEDTNSKNVKSTFSNFSEKKDVVTTGVNWSDDKGRGTVGLNYQFEHGVDSINAFWGATSGQSSPIPAGGNVTAIEANAPYNFTNHVLGVNAMVKPIAKLRVNGDVTYTDSQGAFLTQGVFESIPNIGVPGLQGNQAFNPTDLRILHWGVNASYELCKYTTARAGFRYESWGDRINSLNDGRNTVYDAGLDMKF
jgi:hypothetical protein